MSDADAKVWRMEKPKAPDKATNPFIRSSKYVYGMLMLFFAVPAPVDEEKVQRETLESEIIRNESTDKVSEYGFDFERFAREDVNVSEPSGSSMHHQQMSWECHYSAGTPSSEAAYSPVFKSSYSSLPQTSAVMFLASLAESDSISDGPTDVNDGQEIGEYVLGRIIGRGAYSQCREGRHKANPCHKLALKIVHNQDLYENIEHEIEVWSRLKHKGFLPLLDVVRLHDITVIVSPLAERGSLLKALQTGPMNNRIIKRIFKTLCEALRHLHFDHRIVHHDIKLENILLDQEHNPFLCDFGLSEFVDSYKNKWCVTDASQEELLMKGSFWYLPPEVIDCSRSRRLSMTKEPGLAKGDWALEKTKVDVWALGVVLYAMICGSLPFTDDYLPRLQLSILNGKYPPIEDSDTRLVHLVTQLLQVDPEKRPLISQVLMHDWLTTE